MTKAVITAFHKYTPFGDEFYEPMLNFYIQQMHKYKSEYDKVYVVDSTWNIDISKLPNAGLRPWNFEIIKISPHLRYYDAYKDILPQVKEDAVLFTDNDMVVYKPGKIAKAFEVIDSCVNYWKEGYGANGCKKYGCSHEENIAVASIYDTIGTMKVDLPDGKNKFCPYWFCTKKETLMKYLDVDWSPDAMPYTETFGLLTEAMLKDKLKPYEFEEDKTAIYIDGTKTDPKGKNLGYYHVRAGSTPAYLLATKKYGDQASYWDYLAQQPRNEYLRQCAWYQYMGGDPMDIVLNCGSSPAEWEEYMRRFTAYHGL